MSDFPKTKTFDGKLFDYYSTTHLWDNVTTMVDHLGQEGYAVKWEKRGNVWGVYRRKRGAGL